MIAHQAPIVERGGEHRCQVTGTFYRGVERAHRSSALAGSRRPGRYSADGQSTLYLSSTPSGVATALAAHGGPARDLVVLAFGVRADRIVDLRDPAALRTAGVDLADAIAPWQDVVAAGATPRSWGVRQRLEGLGAHGLVDPSRTHPGLWHLVLFDWNTAGGPRVTAHQDGGAGPDNQAQG